MALTKLAALKACSAPEGRCIMVLGPYCWGRGKTGAEAYRNARRSMIHSYAKRDTVWAFYETPEDAVVTGWGSISWKDGTQEVTELGIHHIAPKGGK